MNLSDLSWARVTKACAATGVATGEFKSGKFGGWEGGSLNHCRFLIADCRLAVRVLSHLERFLPATRIQIHPVERKSAIQNRHSAMVSTAPFPPWKSTQLELSLLHY